MKFLGIFGTVLKVNLMLNWKYKQLINSTDSRLPKNENRGKYFLDNPEIFKRNLIFFLHCIKQWERICLLN